MLSRTVAAKIGGILRHEGDAAAQSAIGSTSAIAMPSTRIAPGLRIVEAQQQLADRALARARGPDERDPFARRDREAEAVQRRLAPSRVG